MKTAIISISLALIAGICTLDARAQETPPPASTAAQSAAGTQVTTADAAARPAEPRVPLASEATALDAQGSTALIARLRTTRLSGTVDAPERNSRLVLENRSPYFYNYVSGWATFYDAEGVRCGEGMWKLEALAPAETAEVDTPGLRLTCAPSTWRIVATNLLTRTTDVAKPTADTPPQPDNPAPASNMTTPASDTTTRTTTLPPLEININGKTLPIQPGNPLDIKVGNERFRIVLNPAP